MGISVSGWFLLPVFLLASIPVIIHLLSRLRLQRRPFPSLLLLQTVRREKFSWLRLQELILLVLRTLALLALLLAFLRPYLRSRILGLEQARDLVLILDDSYSMGYGSRWQTAQERVRELLRLTGSGKKLAFLSATGYYVPAEVGSRQRALVLLDSLEPSGPAPVLGPVLSRGLGVAESLRAQVIVITDLQERAIPEDLELPPGVELILEDVASPFGSGRGTGREPGEDNAGIARLYPAGGMVVPGRPNQLCAEVVNYAEKKTVRTLTLEVEGRRESRMLELNPGGRLTYTFETQLVQPGTYVCRAEISPDSLPVDDVRWLVVHLGKVIPVLVVESEAGSGRYLVSALTADSAAGFVVTVTGTTALSRENLTQYQVVICTDPAALRPADWNRLEHFVRAGGACLFLAGEGFGSFAGPGSWVEATSTARLTGFLSIQTLDTTHPTLWRLQPGIFSSVHIWRRPLLKVREGRILATFSDGSPAVCESPDGRSIVWAIAPVPEFSDLVYRAVFVPFLHQTVAYLSQSLRQTEFAAGDTIRLPVGEAVAVTVVSPGARTVAQSVPEGGQAWAVWKNTRVPGVYSFIWEGAGGEKKEMSVAVNPLAEEGDLRRARPERLASRGYKVRPVGLSYAADLSVPLLFIAAAAFCAEMLLLFASREKARFRQQQEIRTR